MKEKLLKKIEELSIEASIISQKREESYKLIEEIDVRLHQIIGAIKELDSITRSLDDGVNNEDITINQPLIQTNDGKANEATPTVENSLPLEGNGKKDRRRAK